jgi:hypothetical protein
MNNDSSLYIPNHPEINPEIKTAPRHVYQSEKQHFEDPNVGNVDTWITNKRFQNNYSQRNLGEQVSSKEDLRLQ